MFDSQFCSLVTITFLVQLFGLITVIGYRLRGNGRFNHIGLLFGLLIMGGATLACLPFDPAAGMAQGVALVLVATFTSFGMGETSSGV